VAERRGWQFSEEAEASWREYLAHFVEHVYPMFAQHGFSRDTALMAWEITKMANAFAESERDDWQE